MYTILEFAGLTATPMTLVLDGNTRDQLAPPSRLRCKPLGVAANRICPPAVTSTSTTREEGGRLSGVHVSPPSCVRNNPVSVRTSTALLEVTYNWRAGPATL